MDESNGSARVRALVAQMTLEEKTAQLGGFWVDQGDELVAPMAGELASSTRYEDATRDGIGHLTRVYGTRPVDPVERAAWLWGEQRRLRTQTRLGIPAIVHEECLTGLAAWKAATFPTPLAWGASFDPETVEEMARLIGESMRTLGVHQGLAPVLDVIRDPRWGRVDECIAEDPYVVGTIGTAYVRGLQDAGVDATLKHFVGYSASRSGRNHAPVSAGPREVADVLLPPFEMAVRDGGARSVMNSYAEIDGMPVAASTALPDGSAPRHVGLRGGRGRGLLLRPVPAHDARDRRGRGRCGAARPDRGNRRRAAEHRGIRRSPARRGASRARWTKPSSIAPSPGCSRRRSASACSMTRSTSPRPRWTSTRRLIARSPGGWPRSRSSCCPTTARSRSTDRAGSP